MREDRDFVAVAMKALETGDLSTLLNGKNGGERESDGADGIEAARVLLANLDDRLQADVGSAFNPEIVGALAQMQQRDPAAWARAKKVLQKRRVSVRDIQHAITSSRSTTSLEDHGYRQDRRAGDMLPNCPIPWMQVPAGFALDAEGTWQWKGSHEHFGVEGLSKQLVAHSPILIGARFRDIETGVEALHIHWGRPDGWRERTVDRAIALDARRIIELAGEGFPVFSNNAGLLTKYLAAAEAVDWSNLPTAYVSGHLGWQGRKQEHGFLAGRTLVAGNGEIVDTPRMLDTKGHVLGSRSVSFRGLTPGDEQIVDAYHQRGTITDWTQAVAMLGNRPRV